MVEYSEDTSSGAEEFETLVLSGGGVKGFHHLGGLLYLFKRQRRFRRFVGSSIGAIVLALCLAGYEPLELLYIFYRIDFMTLGFTLNLLRLARSCGMNPQSAVEGLLAGLFARKGLPADVTMRQLHERTGVEFEVVVTNLTAFRGEFVHHSTHPDVPVLTALLMSSCVPVVFEPVRYRGELFVDGGISNNYPIERHPRAIGMLIVDVDPARPETPETLVDYMYRLFNYTVFQNVYSKCQQYMDRTVLFHNARRLMPVSFWLRPEDKVALFREGYRLAREFFVQRDGARDAAPLLGPRAPDSQGGGGPLLDVSGAAALPGH